MGLLNREDLLKKEQLQLVKVELGNGDYVFVRQMTAFERDRYEQSLRREVKDAKGEVKIELSLDNFRSKLVACCLSNENGELLLTQPNDYIILAKSISALKMEKIASEAQKLNGITEEEKELLLKNFGVGPADDSNSGSVEK